ncbi:molybdopterin-dependent oxidoreductase [Aquabacterium humicola]|uniref:molybdopterin-dependent oxidoreductase n=1 Tax=Aquabacterium humicola TaxID=3237377 RepID=UPI002543075F|nr:molybdopterin-dependent oxidoreductase [Rubrivivax pictus]
MTSPQTHYRICPLCEACCGLEVRTEGRKVVAIRGLESDVFSHGFICPKAVALKDLHEDPDRLRQPLVKRDGRHVPVSWDEAFAEIERRLPPILAAHGRDALALTVGNPAAHKAGLLLYFARLARAAGTKNLYSASTLDQMPKHLQAGLMFGTLFSIAVPDIVRTDYMLVLGANPIASNGSLWTVPDFRGKAKALRARGGKLVVIDPRRTETADAADEHHFIRPGTDVHLLAAMLNTLFAEGRVRLGRLEPLVAGLDALQQAVAPFTPERAAARCGIPADTIRTLARELADAERGVVYGRIGTCTQAFGTLSQWLIDALNTVTGHLDEPGGAMFSKAAAFGPNTMGPPGKGRGIITGRHASRVSGAPEVFGELPMVKLAEEIETGGAGQVRALITIASNPVLSAPNGPRLSKALDALDFMVSVDIYLNETSRHADVVLPGVSPLQDGHYDVAFPQMSWRNHARYSAPVFARDEGQPAEWQNLLRLTAILKGLGANADLQALDDELTADDVRKLAGEQTPAVMAAVSRWQGPERLVDLALRAGPYGDRFGLKPDGLNLAKVADAPGGIDLGELQPRLPEMLRTPNGKIELAPAPLLADLPRAVADLDAELDRSGAAPMSIIGRRELRSNNSWMHNLPTLAKGPLRCTLLMHPDDAQRLGLSDGALAEVKRAGRAISAPVAISDAMMRGVVSLPHGWGHHLDGSQLAVAAERPGANLNAVLDESLYDPLSGNAVLSGVAVEVAAAT